MPINAMKVEDYKPNQKLKTYHIYDIGFNDGDETEFDVVAGTQEEEMAELMELFIFFLKESNIELKSVDYVNMVGTCTEDEMNA